MILEVKYWHHFDSLNVSVSKKVTNFLYYCAFQGYTSNVLWVLQEMFTVVEFDSGFINMTVIALQNWTEKVYSEVKLALLISFVCVACSKK